MITGFWKTIAVARKELRQIRRDRRTLTILLFVPAFFLLIYGYALSFDIRNIPLAVEDNDRSSASREVISAFVNSGYFDLVAEVQNGEIDRLLDSIAAVVIGGTSLSGGRGSILGTVLGCHIIGVLNNGLGILGVIPEWQLVVKGAVIIMAVAIDQAGRRND